MPSLGLFHRRLLLLLAVVLGTSVVLGSQLVRLAIVEGDEHARQTETFLRRRMFLPFVRGSILDRRGEVLAMDRASWDVQVEYAVIAGRWAADRARVQARRDVGANAWARMSREERLAETEARIAFFNDETERLFDALCEAGGFDRAELDRRFDEIRRRIAPRVEAYRERQRAAEETRVAAGEKPTIVAEDETISEQEAPHTILADVDDTTAFRFQALADALPDTIAVAPATRRIRPWNDVELSVDRSALPGPLASSKPLTITLAGVADHILGSTRTNVFAQDLARRPFLDEKTGDLVDLGGYRSDRDLIGSRGLERTFEDRLRGLRGVVERNLETGEATRTEPQRGEDVRCTLDIRLQSRVQAALEPALGLARVEQWQRGWTADGAPKGGPLPIGWELNGAAVVLDVATGDILALVSTPTLAESSDLKGLRRELEAADYNKPVEAMYPPGSIVKPLLYSGAVTAGVIPLDFEVECKGHFFDNVTTSARCWIWRPEEGRTQTHGRLAVEEAIARSCNIYFYTVASKLGLEGVVEWYRRYGVGQPFDVGLLFARDGENGKLVYEGEVGGSVPSEADMKAMRSAGDRAGPIFLGIGQGPIAWTPLHAANAYATLARGGKIVRPSLMLDRPDRGQVVRDLALSPAAVKKALEGLHQAVSATYGTGNHLTFEDGVQVPLTSVPGTRIWAKTGTAQAPPLRLDENGDGAIDATVQADHAWFVGLVGNERDATPRYAVAVLVEHGGSGGKTAGPIAAEIVRALVAEGYLNGAGS
ncbi:MAG: penicillin-binding transpeptidase domain-containing protein [Phycisphaerales bacterium]